MGWQGIVSILSGIAALIAILGLVYNLGKMNAKIEILWEAYKAEGRQSTKRRGTMETQSQYRLTKQGLDMIPPDLKDEIKALADRGQGIKAFLFNRKKLNPDKAQTWDIIKKLGGVERLAEAASSAGCDVQEMIVMIETFIQRHLEE